MPVMDGYDSTRDQGNGKDKGTFRAPVFAVTADVVTGTEDRCLTAGMNGLLTKPLSEKDLRPRL